MGEQDRKQRGEGNRRPFPQQARILKYYFPGLN